MAEMKFDPDKMWDGIGDSMDKLNATPNRPPEYPPGETAIGDDGYGGNKTSIGDDEDAGGETAIGDDGYPGGDTAIGDENADYPRLDGDDYPRV
ncbi:hypothetical protein [Agromyces bracchium]|uniref:Uncharacterized protein n=1 Tax=Agromyces bracchium TaxID=88376 RepID=A0A6I3MCU7_9MICO|nr:hypothetical protein [Agromyces bracchium]MTH68233.1 hypothetical protein [Agromyces bracchium]